MAKAKQSAEAIRRHRNCKKQQVSSGLEGVRIREYCNAAALEVHRTDLGSHDRLNPPLEQYPAVENKVQYRISFSHIKINIQCLWMIAIVVTSWSTSSITGRAAAEHIVCSADNCAVNQRFHLREK